MYLLVVQSCRENVKLSNMRGENSHSLISFFQTEVLFHFHVNLKFHFWTKNYPISTPFVEVPIFEPNPLLSFSNPNLISLHPWRDLSDVCIWGGFILHSSQLFVNNPWNFPLVWTLQPITLKFWKQSLHIGVKFAIANRRL